MTYYVVFEYEGKPVCGCWQRGKDKEEATLKAEFALLAACPDIKYDNTFIRESKE